MAQSLETLNRSLRAGFEQDARIAALYVFGSYAKGTAGPLSDIDIGILLNRAVARTAYFDLRLRYIAEAMTLLRTERVDVVLLNDAPTHLAYEVISRGVLVLEGNRRGRVAFEADRITRYLDIKPLFAAQVRATKEHLLKGTYFD
jgi:predicted nucleotidyltransferase